MVALNDDVVIIMPPETPGGPTLITINCPDKTGLGCDLCNVLLLFGLRIVRGDLSTDGKWCYVVFWVVDKGRKATRWSLLKRRLLAACPSASYLSGIDDYFYRNQETGTDQKPKLFFLKFSCHDRMGLLHDVTEVLCDLELTIRRVKVSTTPDGRVMDLFLITDARELLHTNKRQDDVCNRLRNVLGDSVCSCSIEPANAELAACLQASSSLPPPLTVDMLALEFQDDDDDDKSSGYHSRWSAIPSVSIDNSLSHVHSLVQIQCHDYKGLLYDIMRILKDYNIQISYGRLNAIGNENYNIDLFVQTQGKKILEPNNMNDICSRLRTELSSPLIVNLFSRGPDTELIVANPVELSGTGRPLVLYDITLALKMLKIRIFLAEISRHVNGDREWELFRVHLGEEHELCATRQKIVERVTKMLMGWH